MTGPTTYSMIGAGIYLGVCALSIAAALVSTADRNSRNQRIGWVLIGVLFAILAASRIFMLEEHLRGVLRSMLRANSEYGMRRMFQLPVTILVLIVGALIAGATVHWERKRAGDRRSRLLSWAWMASGIMMLLLAARIVSFHTLDMILGTFRLNWIIDIGSSLAVGILALAYMRMPEPKRRTSSRR